MKSIWEVCEFSDEIKTGDLRPEKFALELFQFLAGDADPIYQDPVQFFDNTILTDQMRMILKESLLRLSKGKGAPVTVIDTGFGGGKTHTIVMLHHVYNNPKIGKKFLKDNKFDSDYGITDVPKAKMIAIDCRNITKTLWGEIAKQLGKYDIVKEYDEKFQTITIDKIKQLFDQPTLLLLDELPKYLLDSESRTIGNATLSDLTISFVMDLTSAVSATKDCCLILTLTEKQQLYEKYTDKVNKGIKKLTDYSVEKVYDDFKDGLSRNVVYTQPVSDIQIYDILVKRLVKKIDAKQREDTVSQFVKYLSENNLVPEQRADYEDEFRRAYPFHPNLIDILRTRLSTIPKFNKTRGMLRLLGLILHNIYKNKKNYPIVNVSDMDFTDAHIVDEITTKLDKPLRPVIDSDCIFHARELDSHKSTKLVESMAKSILMFSLFMGSRKSGMPLNEIKLSVCTPGVDPGMVDTVLEEIEKSFWFLKEDGKSYYFDETPNLNQIIYSYRKNVTEKECRDRIYAELVKIVPRESKVIPIIWDQNDIPDNEDLKIFIEDYKIKLDTEEKAQEHFARLLERTSTDGLRQYQNTIVFVYADKMMVNNLINSAKNAVAVDLASKDDKIKTDKDFNTKIIDRKNLASGALNLDCFKTYCKVAYPFGPTPRLDQISSLDAKTHVLTKEVQNLLIKKGKLIPSLGEDGIKFESDKIEIKRIYLGFKTDKSSIMIINSEDIFEAIQSGVRNGKFGYAEKEELRDGKYVAKINTHVDIKNWSGYLYNPSVIAGIEYFQCPQCFMQFDNNVELEKHKCTPLPPAEFKYRFLLATMDEMSDILNKLTIIQVNEKLKKKFTATLRSDDTIITIDTRLESLQEFKSLITQLKSRYLGQGELTIDSDKDLSQTFKQYALNPQ